MTELLERAFAEASRLWPAEQETLTFRLLADLAAEDEFDRKFAGSVNKVVGLAREVLEEDRAGATENLNERQV